MTTYYPYESIVIEVDDKDELRRLRPYIKRFIIWDVAVHDIAYKMINRPEVKNYIRVNIEDELKDWHISHGTIEYLLSDSSDITYDKIFTVKDVEDGILDNLIKYGKPFRNPSYRPRKIS